ncbi:MAG: 1-phosphofructokinase family hexose kinase [Dehalococcoidia bacterium]|nr:1-phosphofructokinase family hexose kinase [Dehalococcoidia bacterium]
MASNRPFNMIVTVTLNTSIDRTLFVKDFTWNQTIRASQSVLGMGGKATDASWVLGELGYDNLATGFAAGDTGRLMDKMLRQRGCKTDFVWVKGETRTNVVVIGEQGQGQTTLISRGLEINKVDIDEFNKKFISILRDASCVLIGGSLPAGVEASFYTHLVEQARSSGLPVVFDASGPGLKAGMQGHPTIAKPNIDEIAELSGRDVTTIESAYRAGTEIYKQFGTMLVITLGAEGALAILEGRSYRIPVLNVPVVSTAGAGDAVLAGLTASLSKSKSIEDGLRLGFAAAAAVCLTPATADCRRSDVGRYMPQIQLIPYPE